MELYTSVSYDLSKQLTLSYSSSFGISSRLFTPELKLHIYAVYGLVRIADEIVDTYRGEDAREQLDAFEKDTLAAIETGYSTNPIIHAFAQTARKYTITIELLQPFFASMRIDLSPAAYRDEDYQSYIHGSAEVVGLMCLKVFCEGDERMYTTLAPGATALGAAYQKVNFLRDIASDHTELGRMYFPGINFDTFDEREKALIVADIKADFNTADSAIHKLPTSCRTAVRVSYTYYTKLLKKLGETPVSTLKERRIRISTPRKLWLLMKTVLTQRIRS